MKIFKIAAAATIVTALLPLASHAAAYQTTRKFHPGHYSVILPTHNGVQKYMDDARRPGMVGIMKRYSWRELEPTQGNYDFSKISSDLLWAQAYGMQLIIMIEDKSFTLVRPNPAYLDSVTPRNRTGGYSMVRWHPTVVTRYKALVAEMGKRFDSHPNFEGIGSQESSIGLDRSTLTAFDFTPEKFRDAYIEMFSYALSVMPRSRVFWYQNFMVGNQDYIGAVAQAVGPKGLVMAGPDVLPDRAALMKNSYPYFDQFAGQMHLGIQVEGICYRALHETAGYPTKYWTMLELFRFARDELHVNYMFWVRIPTPKPADSYSWTHALPVIESNPMFNMP